jgi:ABC-type phosphate/phosphonate transport system ATPase subunit
LVILEKLQARFSCDTLNIGVIGIMRQGKSTLLQSLTGLGNNVIPAQSGGACTAEGNQQ